jgi:hypothetical protein
VYRQSIALAIGTGFRRKYSDLFQLANTVGLKNPDVKEEAGKLRISGKTEHQLDANQFWDNIQPHGGW